MFVIRPVDDRNKLKELFDEAKLTFGETSHGVIAEENNTYAGNCLFSLNDYNVKLLNLTYFNDDTLMGDTLLRAALNYAANRDGYTCETELKQHDALLRALGFPENNGVYSSTIPEILSSPCSHGCGTV